MRRSKRLQEKKEQASVKATAAVDAKKAHEGEKLGPGHVGLKS